MNDPTRRGFLGVLAAVPLSVKAAFHNLGRRENRYPLFEEGAEQIESGEVEAEMSSKYEDITELTSVTGVRFFDKDGNVLTTHATFEANPEWNLANAKSIHIGTVVGGTFWLPAGTLGFMITSFELLDSRGRTVWGPLPVGSSRFVVSGDTAHMELTLD